MIGNHPRVHAYLYAAAPRSGGPAIVNIAHERESAGRRIARFAYRRFGALVVIGANAAREYEARLPGVEITKVNNFLAAADFERARGERVLSPHHDEQHRRRDGAADPREGRRRADRGARRSGRPLRPGGIW